MQLRQWRYGPETDQLVQSAWERESWSVDRWNRWQQEQLAEVLHRAATTVPYYSEYWQARRRAGDKTSWENLENWPVLDKNAVRENPEAFVARDRDMSDLFHDHTSGTSGKPLNLFFSRTSVRGWYALMEARGRGWFGLTRHDRWAIFGGQLVVAQKKRTPPFWVWNAGLNQLYCSSYHLAPDLIPSYAKALAQYKVKYLLGYTSSLYAIASVALQHGIDLPEMRVVLTNAEPVFAHQRDAIARAFRCQVAETYGMAEIVTGASECQHGTLHSWPELGCVEIVNEEDRTGDLVCTSLLNRDMPLIRYRIGDRVQRASPGRACECGRCLPEFGTVQGRADDVVYTTDGRAVGRLDPIFKSSLPIHEAQIIQETYTRIRLRIVPVSGYSEHTGAILAARIRERLGDVQVDVELVAEIERTSAGKFRAVICNISESRGTAMTAGVQ